MESAREDGDVDERAPLLGNGPADPHYNGEHGNHSDQQDTDTVIANEPTMKEVLAIMLSIWVGVFFAALDTTVVATLTAPISSSFDSLSLLSWLATGYLISNAACQPLSGKLTDIFSRRYGLVFSNVVFAIGTLICGLAPNASAIIAGRVIAGIGGGGLTSISTFVTSDLVPLRRRGVWQGFGNLVFGLGMGLGGLFGGLCADYLTWRWAFLIQVPFIVVSTAFVWFLVKVPVNPSTKPALSRIDFTGALMLIASLVFLLLGLNTGGNQLPWKSWQVIISLVVAAVAMAAFFFIESSPKLAPEPVIPVMLIIRTRTIFAACLTNWFATMSGFLALYFVPFYLQSILGYSPTEAGLRTIPYAVGLSLGSLGSGYIMKATGRYYLLSVFDLILLVLGAALLVTVNQQTPEWATYIYFIPLGIAYGSMLTITLVAMISAVDHKHQAVITAASYAFRSTGSSIGVTIGSTLFNNILTQELRAEYGHMKNSEQVIRRIRNSLDAVKDLPKGWDVEVVKSISMDAVRGAFIAGLALAALSALTGFGMREHVLHKNLARR